MALINALKAGLKSSGIMMIDSHNPPEYNGFKIMIAGETLSGECIQVLYQRIQTQDFSTGHALQSRLTLNKTT